MAVGGPCHGLPLIIWHCLSLCWSALGSFLFLHDGTHHRCNTVSFLAWIQDNFHFVSLATTLAQLSSSCLRISWQLGSSGIISIDAPSSTFVSSSTSHSWKIPVRLSSCSSPPIQQAFLWASSTWWCAIHQPAHSLWCIWQLFHPLAAFLPTSIRTPADEFCWGHSAPPPTSFLVSQLQSTWPVSSESLNKQWTMLVICFLPEVCWTSSPARPPPWHILHWCKGPAWCPSLSARLEGQTVCLNW